MPLSHQYALNRFIMSTSTITCFAVSAKNIARISALAALPFISESERLTDTEVYPARYRAALSIIRWTSGIKNVGYVSCPGWK